MGRGANAQMTLAIMQTKAQHKFHLNRPLKTDILNIFRRVLRLRACENFIANKTIRNPRSIWSKFVPPNYLYPLGSVREVIREGIRFELDISHVVDHYIFFGLVDSDYTHIKKKIVEAKVILDIGANMGSTSLRFANMNPNATLYSFEPHPKTHKRALKNLSLNKHFKVMLQEMGLGEKKDTLRLYEVNEHNPGMNRILQGEQGFPYAEIEISTLDDFVIDSHIESIDLIKVDVEGFEYAVLKGGERILKRIKPVLFLELDDENLRDNGRSAAELIGLLRSYGYQDFVRADNLVPITENSDFTCCHFDVIIQ
jgi:FkbM family methyltransferase